MLISIDDKDSRPIYQQLVGQIREQVSRGIIKPGDELPSVRELSDSLGINMHTVRRAYLMLRDQGTINLRLGRRARISHGQPRSTHADTKDDIQQRLKDLVTDALLSGLTPEEFGDMVEKQIKNRMKTDFKENLQ